MPIEFNFVKLIINDFVFRACFFFQFQFRLNKKIFFNNKNYIIEVQLFQNYTLTT